VGHQSKVGRRYCNLLVTGRVSELHRSARQKAKTSSSMKSMAKGFAWGVGVASLIELAIRLALQASGPGDGSLGMMMLPLLVAWTLPVFLAGRFVDGIASVDPESFTLSVWNVLLWGLLIGASWCLASAFVRKKTGWQAIKSSRTRRYRQPR